jgi:hypothetical protein
MDRKCTFMYIYVYTNIYIYTFICAFIMNHVHIYRYDLHYLPYSGLAGYEFVVVPSPG